VAVATDTDIANLKPGITRLDLNAPETIADFVERHWALTPSMLPHTAESA
jgi:hypothetical protein